MVRWRWRCILANRVEGRRAVPWRRTRRATTTSDLSTQTVLFSPLRHSLAHFFCMLLYRPRSTSRDSMSSSPLPLGYFDPWTYLEQVKFHQTTKFRATFLPQTSPLQRVSFASAGDPSGLLLVLSATFPFFSTAVVHADLRLPNQSEA